MKKLARILGALVASATLAGLASARTMPANMGAARFGSQAAFFSHSVSTGAVTSTGNADWALGLPGDFAGFKSVSVTARATSLGARCRAASNDATGTMASASAFMPIPVSAAYVSLPAMNVNLPFGGVLFVDCILNNGASVLRADYNQ